MWNNFKTMAALVRHGGFKSASLLRPKNTITGGYATKAEKKKGIDKKVGPTIDSSAESLAAKGFLRPQKPYQPPEDVKTVLQAIFQRVLGTTDQNTQIQDLNKRFSLFVACSEQLQHTIPNSLLHTIKTTGDIQKFYETPVEVTTPLDKLQNMELPENLHVQYEYHRFHPDTDTKFNGITAFPESSTIVTGLRYKDKYKGHVQKQKFPHI